MSSRTAGASSRRSPALTPTSTSPCSASTPATRRPCRWEPEGRAEPAIGAPVVALANPGGRGLRATLGFVSSGPRSFRGPRGRRIRGAIEHTAPLPRGSSGGPLAGPDGDLLGVNSLRLDGGLILAVPAGAAVKERVLLLARGEAAAPHRLGVAIAPPRVARRLRTRGRAAASATACSCAPSRTAARRTRRASSPAIWSWRPATRPIESVESLYTALDSVPAAGGELELTVVRGTDERTVTARFEGRRAA